MATNTNISADLKDTRVLLTFVNSIFDDIFTPEIMLNDKWSVNLALESLCNLFRISSDFDSEVSTHSGDKHFTVRRYTCRG